MGFINKGSYFDFKSQFWSTFFASFGYCNDAIAAVTQVFADPTCTHLKGFNKIPSLFSSETECFAYIKCNPELSNEAIITLLLGTVDVSFKHNPALVEKNIWQFASDHPSWSKEFGSRFFKKYPAKLTSLQDQIVAARFPLSDMQGDTPPNLLKGLLLKLSFLSPEVLYYALKEVNLNRQSWFMLALNGLRNRHEEMLMLVNLIKKITLDDSKKLLERQDRGHNNADNNIFTLLLKESLGHPQAVRELINIILTIPEEHIKNSMKKFKNL